MPRSITAPCRIEKITWRGFEAFMLENAVIRVTVVPALGGKIASLVYLPSMREWLWRNPGLEPQVPVYGGDYVGQHDVGGFDECFPSVAATHYPGGPWDGTKVPDHGELWSLPWKAEPLCDGNSLELKLSVSGVRFPMRLERTLYMAAHDPALHLAYTATNPTSFDFPFLWCAHPLFNVTPGMKLVLPVRDMQLYSSARGGFGKLGRPVAWPNMVDGEGKTWDLSSFPEIGAGIALKLVGKAPTQGFVALQDIYNGAELRIQFDPTEVTHMGVWLNYSGWSGVPGASPYFNVAIEPGIGLQDDLAQAVKNYGEHGTLPANGRRNWALELRLK